jgi:putative glutamine amidotransferase
MKRTRKPLIGVTPDTHGGHRLKTRARDEKVLYLYDRYYRAVQDHGAAPVVLPITADKKTLRDTVRRLDGLLLIGGNFDVPPQLFGERPIPELGIVKRSRSEYEIELIKAAERVGLPILAVCGGMQTVNVSRGGTLYQDINSQRPGSREHQQTTPKTRVAHQVTVEPGSALHRIVTGKRSRQPFRLGVNSTHHQAIRDLGRGLKVSARAADGIVEGLEGQGDAFLIGVQWHPELLYRRHPSQARLFQALTRAARRFGAARCQRRS